MTGSPLIGDVFLQKARFVDRLAPQSEWRFVHRMADAAYGSVQARTRSALVSITASHATLVDALRNGDVVAAVAAFDFRPMNSQLQERVLPLLWAVYLKTREFVLRAAQRGRLSKAFIPPEAFEQVSPNAVAWAQKAGTMIGEITEETRRAIRIMITEGFNRGIPPILLAVRLRESVGLTERQTESIERLRRELQESGLPAATVENRIRDARMQMLRFRTENIARTETLAAANAGQLDAWQTAKSEGLLDPDLVKEWIITPDDRLCPICAGLHGERRPLAEAFSVGVLTPPAHPMCRCAQGLAEPKR